MRIEVKQEHIDEGTQGCPCYCAVSLAVYDALKNRYKFTNSGSLDITNEEVLIGESWVETAVQGSGAEISIYTKHFNNTKEEIEIVEDFIAIEDEAPINSMNALILEEWIEDFDTYEVEPTSFVIESINRMNK